MYNVSTNQREDFVLLANQLQKKGPVLGARYGFPRLATVVHLAALGAS